MRGIIKNAQLIGIRLMPYVGVCQILNIVMDATLTGFQTSLYSSYSAPNMARGLTNPTNSSLTSRKTNSCIIAVIRIADFIQAYISITRNVHLLSIPLGTLFLVPQYPDIKKGLQALNLQTFLI